MSTQAFNRITKSPKITEKQMQKQMKTENNTEMKQTVEKMTRELDGSNDNDNGRLYQQTWRERNSSLWDTFMYVIPTISRTEYGDSQIGMVFPWQVTRSFPGLIDGVGFGDTPEDALRMAKDAFESSKGKSRNAGSKRRLEQMLLERKLDKELKEKHREEKRKRVCKRRLTM